jgi:hypothetical protein
MVSSLSFKSLDILHGAEGSQEKQRIATSRFPLAIAVQTVGAQLHQKIGFVSKER